MGGKRDVQVWERAKRVVQAQTLWSQTLQRVLPARFDILHSIPIIHHASDGLFVCRVAFANILSSRESDPESPFQIIMLLPESYPGAPLESSLRRRACIPSLTLKHPRSSRLVSTPSYSRSGSHSRSRSCSRSYPRSRTRSAFTFRILITPPPPPSDPPRPRAAAAGASR